MTAKLLPIEGTNKLTEELLANGVKLEASDTWPEDVYCVDGKHFVYRAEWWFREKMIWESPCGLMAKGPGQFWGDLKALGEYHCVENGNSLFRCPYAGRKCPDKLPLPPGINCQFHRTEKAYDPQRDIHTIESEERRQLHAWYEKDLKEHPGYDTLCANAKEQQGKDGAWEYRFPWKLYDCVNYNCRNTCCPARGWKPRNISKANIFYDVYIERRYEDEYLGAVFPRIEKTMRTGLKVFDKAVARTDAEMSLKIWERNPFSPILPMALINKLNPLVGLSDKPRDGSREAYFIENHGVYEGKRYSIYAELRNVRVASFDQRDILQDLQDVKDGIEVVHASDITKQAEQTKKEKRKKAQIEKAARIYAKGDKGSRWFAVQPYISNAAESKETQKKKEAMMKAIKSRAEEIAQKEKVKAERQALKDGQISLFDN